ncbi:MAG: efflux RND transporter permease subunit [bacterium]|nr:efflux RND transporter permease subunit [bacterium]
MSSIIRYFVTQKLIMWLMVGFLVLGSLVSLLSLQRESFPRVEFHQARLTTVFPGAAAVDVEQRVTIPIEEELREIEGLKKVRSISRQSVSEINVEVDLNEKDPDGVLDEVRRVLDRVTDLPPEVTDRPVFTEIKSGTFPVLEISIYGARNEMELYEMGRFYERQLEKVPGVARVDVFGERDREWHILIQPDKMVQSNVSLMDVSRAISGRNVDVPGGVLEAEAAQNIRTSAEFNTIEELGGLPVIASEIGNQIYLRDLARFEDTYERPQLLARTDGQAAVNLQVLKRESADVLTLVDNVRARMDELREAQAEDSTLKTLIVNDFSRQTRRQLDVVTNNALIGLALVVIILLVFLNSRMAVITALSLPLVMGGALMSFPIADISLNMMSMMGLIIALGMLVDNSIVIAENVYRYREEGYPPAEAAVKGATELMVPIIGSFLTTAAAFLPMMFMSGLMGKFVWQIPFVVIVVLAGSLFESFFLLPARIAYYGGPEAMQARQNPLRRAINAAFDRVSEAFARFAARIVRHPFRALSVVISILALAFFGLANMKFSLFPKEEVEEFLVTVEFAPSLRVSQTMDKVGAIEDIVRKLPDSELISYSLKGGLQQRDPNDPLQRVGEHLAMVHVFLTPEVTRTRKAREIIDELEPQIREIPGLVNMAAEELVPSPPIGPAISVSIEGPEYETLRQISGEIKEFLKTVKGPEGPDGEPAKNAIYGIDDDYKYGREELVVKLNQEAAAQAGIRAAEVAMIVRTAFEGNEVSTLRQGTDEITLRVLYDGPYRARPETLGRLRVPNRIGLMTRLDAISTRSSNVSPEALSHYNYERSVVVTASIYDDLITSNEANAKIFKKFEDIPQRYPGYAVVLRGESDDTNESMASLGRAGLFAIFAIFAILAVIFNDARKPLLILATIPLGIVGIVVGFLISAKALSFLAMIGIIGLAGVQVNASIMLIAFIDQLRRSGMDPRQALVQAARQRFRPILLTTLTTMGGLFPTAYSLGGSDPMLIPVTLALAWGLAFGTFGSLVFVPAVFAANMDLRDFRERRRQRARDASGDGSRTEFAETTVHAEGALSRSVRGKRRGK